MKSYQRMCTTCHGRRSDPSGLFLCEECKGRGYIDMRKEEFPSHNESATFNGNDAMDWAAETIMMAYHILGVNGLGIKTQDEAIQRLQAKLQELFDAHSITTPQGRTTIRMPDFMNAVAKHIQELLEPKVTK